jgi:hypothetical protein
MYQNWGPLENESAVYLEAKNDFENVSLIHFLPIIRYVHARPESFDQRTMKLPHAFKPSTVSDYRVPNELIQASCPHCIHVGHCDDAF